MSSNVSDSVVHFLSGALGGVVSTAATYPMLNLSTRLQLHRRGEQQQQQHHDGNNTLQVLKDVLASPGGVASLYAGFSSAIFGVAVSQGVFYWSYELIKEHWAATVKRKAFTTLENLVIAALAGVATAVSVNPIWVVNTRMSVRSKEGAHEDALRVLSDIVRTEGVAALFNGVGPALILVVNPSIQYMVFEQLKQRVEAARKVTGRTLGDLDFFWLGLVSKFVASTVTYPLMVVKSRMQAKEDDARRKYAGTRDALAKIFRSEGLEGLFKGYAPKISQSVLAAAILFLAKEKFFAWTVTLLVLLNLKKAKLAPPPGA